MPQLMEENVEAVRIYLIVKNQFIMGLDGPIDINQLPIHAAMRLYKIKNRQNCFEKVLLLADHFMEKY